MSWERLVRRNSLLGGYDGVSPVDGFGGPPWTEMDQERFKEHPRQLGLNVANRSMIAGDMRRLEADSRDDWHLARYAKAAGVTTEQAKLLLDEFFES